MVENELFYVNATVRSSKKHDIYTTTKTKESNEVWLNGKIFLALLIEKYLGDIDFPLLEHPNRNGVYGEKRNW